MIRQSALADMYQSVEASQLGALIETYETQVKRSGKIVFWAFILILLLLVGFIIWLLTFLDMWNTPFFSPLLLLLIIGGPFLALTVQIVPIFFTLRTHNMLVTPLRRKIFVYLYTGGIIYREGRKRQIVPWKQIKLIQRQSAKIWKKPQIFYVLHLQNGSQIVLRQIIFDVQKLGSAIEAEVTKQFLPKVLADYQDNKQVVVPGLCITRQYISNSDEKLSWQQLSEIKVGPEKLIIKEKSSSEDWVVASIPQFPNLCVLIALLIYIKQEQDLDLQLVQ